MHVLLALFLAAAPAADATSQATAAAAQPAEAKAAKDDKICVTKPQLGTRFKTRTCYTKAEYERRQLEERQALERLQRLPLKGE
jgi:ABC-type sugar transport system substrate-binding protein